MTKSQTYLERPVAFRTAAQKVAQLRGDHGREGGWIYSGVTGLPMVHGWELYGQRLAAAGVIAQDPEHDGANGKWFVNLFVLTERELQNAELLWS